MTDGLKKRYGIEAKDKDGAYESSIRDASTLPTLQANDNTTRPTRRPRSRRAGAPIALRWRWA